MLTLLSQRNFGLLWVAHTFSIIGDYVFFIAITFWIYEQTGSATATGAVLISSTVPGILFAPLAGIIVDRWSRRSIMLVAESARAVLFLALLGTIIVQPHALWPIYVVGFIQSAIATFFWSARGALMPQMLEPSSLMASNALYLLSDGAVRVIAPSLSTFFLLRWGPPGIVAIDAATFIISAGGICLLNSSAIHPPENDAVSQESTPPSQPMADSTPKKRWILQASGFSQYVRILFLLGAIIAYTAGTLNILYPVFIRTALSAGPLAFGWMLTASALGEGTMSLLLGRKSLWKGRLALSGSISACLAMGGFMLVLIVYSHALVPALLLNLIFGAMTAAVTIQILTLLQQRVANRLLGRTLAAASAFQSLAQVTGMGIASLTLASIGITWLMLCNGVLYLLGSALAWLLPSP